MSIQRDHRPREHRLAGGGVPADKTCTPSFRVLPPLTRGMGAAPIHADVRAQGNRPYLRIAASIRSSGIAYMRKSLAPVMVSAASSALVMAASVACAVA